MSFIEITDFRIKFIAWINLKKTVNFWLRKCIKTPIPSNTKHLNQALKYLERFEEMYKVELS